MQTPPPFLVYLKERIALLLPMPTVVLQRVVILLLNQLLLLLLVAAEQMFPVLVVQMGLLQLMLVVEPLHILTCGVPMQTLLLFPV